MRIGPTRPTRESIESTLQAAEADQLSYSQVGRTASTSPPKGFKELSAHVSLPAGSFETARKVISKWRAFPRWVEVATDGPMKAGTNVVLVSRQLGLWAVVACRVVYVVDSDTEFGFAYGTLGNHVESGEERFTVQVDGSGVTQFRVNSFSRPNHLLTRIGAPLARHTQRRFIRDAGGELADSLATK